MCGENRTHGVEWGLRQEATSSVVISAARAAVPVVRDILVRKCKGSNSFVGCMRRSLIQSLVSMAMEGERKSGIG